jgi:biotin operon repressor
MRASRLVSILLLLQSNGRMTAQELADELEVSVRTVYRDMDSLGAAGIPLYGEAGHEGGYRLIEGYRTRLTGLTTGEAESLFLTGLPSAAADLGLGASVAAAQLKLMAALPPELRDRAGRVAERFHLDAPSWYRDADSAPQLGGVAAAVWDQRVIRIRYLRWENRIKSSARSSLTVSSSRPAAGTLSPPQAPPNGRTASRAFLISRHLTLPSSGTAPSTSQATGRSISDTSTNAGTSTAPPSAYRLARWPGCQRLPNPPS